MRINEMGKGCEAMRLKGWMVFVVALLMTLAVRAQQVIDDKTPAARTQRIVLVGDSTMNHSTGWGSGFCDDLAGDVECFNMARNGRSSKSYRMDGFWARALALKPTYMLIGFGANDGGASRGSEAHPGDSDGDAQV
jgi:hypothetical protein